MKNVKIAKNITMNIIFLCIIALVDPIAQYTEHNYIANCRIGLLTTELKSSGHPSSCIFVVLTKYQILAARIASGIKRYGTCSYLGALMW